VHLELSDEQSAVQEAFAALFAKESAIERVREVERTPTCFDDRLWARLREAGVPELAAPSGGATVVDQALICEQAGRHLAAVPLVEALVATWLVGDADVPTVEADDLVVWSPHPADADGRVPLVPGGAVADVVVARWSDGVLAVARSQAPGAASPAIGRGPVHDRSVSGGHELFGGDPHVLAGPQAEARWLVLAAAQLAGLAERAQELGVRHASERVQFGAPIGSFQAVQQAMADVAPLVSGAKDLARKAAWSLDVVQPHAGELALAAFLAAGEAARRAADVSLHVHGGYGFAEEGDISLFFRRAAQWSAAVGDPAGLRVRLARLHASRRGTTAGGPFPAVAATRGLDFGPVADAEQVRAEMAAFLDERLTDEVLDRAHDTGTMHDWGLHRALAEAGWLGAGWPEETGGQGRDAFGLAAVQEELRRRGAPLDGWGTTELVAHVIDEAGTEEQKAQVIGPFLRGELLIALGYSEPEAGSDVASVATRAVLDETTEEWVIDGQKMFTTLAHEAQLVFLLARTNQDVPKHRGLTLFLVPMHDPGIEVQPVPTLGGERTNITFYDGVRVPDSARVGEVDGGWDVMKVALAHERSPAMLAELDRLRQRIEVWAVEDQGARRPIDEDLVAERLGRAAVQVEVGRCLADRMTWVLAEGGLPITEGSLAKLYTSETLKASAADLLDVLGVDGLRDRHDPSAPLGGWVEHAHRHAQVVTIYAGTSEIQRSIIAERHLGLPRAR
jgi:alkylation response protein AidB-like acyl-CoA dehydrogenase